MRRKVIAITALVCLAVVGSAYAATAFNSYTASFAFKGAAGSKKKPAPISYKLVYNAANTTKGDRAWPLVDIKNTLDGVTSNWKKFPTCSAATIGTQPNFNKSCPKGSLVASGTVKSALGPSIDPATSAGIPCNLQLVVYNEGKGKLVYFFVITQHGSNCGGLVTGAAAPYVATTKEIKGNLYEDVPLPADVSTEAGGLSGTYGSLEHEVLTFNAKVKVKGKTYPFLASTGCTKNKHKWSVTFKATNGKISQTKTLTGASKC